MKFLAITTALMMVVLTACETTVLEHIHPEIEHTLLEHTHDLNLNNLLPDPEQPEDLNLNDLLKIIDDTIAATDLMYEIIDDTIENWLRAEKKYVWQTVTIRATVKEVEDVGEFLPWDKPRPIIWVHLENRRNFPFYMNVSSVPDWKNSFKVGQTYTFTVRIENIGRPKIGGIGIGGHGELVVQCKLIEN